MATSIGILYKSRMTYFVIVNRIYRKYCTFLLINKFFCHFSLFSSSFGASFSVSFYGSILSLLLSKVPITSFSDSPITSNIKTASPFLGIAVTLFDIILLYYSSIAEILSTRFAWRPPSNSVCNQMSTISNAKP